MSLRLSLVALAVLLALPAAPTRAQNAPAAEQPPPTTAEPAPTAPPAKPPAPAPVLNKWTASLYGFPELDAIWDSTQSVNDLAGNALIARPGTYKGSGHHNRVQFSPRNSRIGFKLSAPAFDGMKVSATIEGDFYGNQAAPPATSEATYYASPLFRIRHAFLKLETRWVDVTAGQTWELLGWQGYFIPASVNLQGLPGQVYSRTPQLRLSKVIPLSAIDVEAAVAALRPPQRDAGVPDGQAGVRVLLHGRKGVHTLGGSSTVSEPGGIGLSGAYRKFVVNRPTGGGSSETNGWAYSVDAFIPILAAPAEGRGGAFTFTGSFVQGAGFSDQYTGLTGGSKTIGAFTGAPATYAANVDDGFVAFDAAGKIHAIDWRSWMVGLQYYLPPSGNVFVSANYTDMFSSNITRYAAPDTVFRRAHYADANVFWDVTPAVRFAGGFMWFYQEYGDGVKAINRRVQLSALYLF
jgi:hypothetical protein